MLLPKAPATYDHSDQAQLRGALVREDKRNVKQGAPFDKITMKDLGTGEFVVLTVVSGSLVIT